MIFCFDLSKHKFRHWCYNMKSSPHYKDQVPFVTNQLLKKESFKLSVENCQISNCLSCPVKLWLLSFKKSSRDFWDIKNKKFCIIFRITAGDIEVNILKSIQKKKSVIFLMINSDQKQNQINQNHGISWSWKIFLYRSPWYSADFIMKYNKSISVFKKKQDFVYESEYVITCV